MPSPIQNRVGCVFIPVSDMERSITWYSRLLGLPVKESSHGGKIYDLDVVGETGIILDGHKEVRNSSQPLFFFLTMDIEKTYGFLREHEVEIVSEIEDIGSVSTLVFKDPDDNLLMVCEPN